MAIPSEMKAAVYTGEGRVEVQSIACPELGRGEVLIKVDSCGICHTDLKKVEYNLLPPPRVFGHETAGQIVAVADGVEGWEVGDRAVVFHHIPCGDAFTASAACTRSARCTESGRHGGLSRPEAASPNMCG